MGMESGVFAESRRCVQASNRGRGGRDRYATHLGEQTENLWFIGNRNSEELFEAIGQNKANLMCLIYDFSKKETNVLRATNNQLQGHVYIINIFYNINII